MRVLFHQEGNTPGFFHKFLLVLQRTGLLRTLMLRVFLFCVQIVQFHPIRLEWCAAYFGGVLVFSCYSNPFALPSVRITFLHPILH